jgi:predicted amidohydrolase YtcJ
MGLTGVHDFDQELCYQALITLVERGELKLRVLKSVRSKDLNIAIERGLKTGIGNDWMWIGGVKDFADGALGPQTASMLEPYQGTDHRGLSLLSEEELFELGVKAADGGLALSIHAIGDLANRTVLNALERLRAYEKKNEYKSLPHRIEHLQLIDPSDVDRLAKLEITASMQPIHAISDMDMADKYWGNRTAYSYASQLQFQEGARVVFGSDAPVESPNPFWGIHAAVTRQKADGFPGPDGWHPELRVTRDKAIKAYTTGPAAAAGKSKIQGCLTPGSWADIIVLEKDPFDCAEVELREIKPVGTMVGGSWVWRDF